MRGKKRPLYVDDSRIMRELVQHYFSGLNHIDLIVASDSEEALLLVEDRAVDLVACEFDLRPVGGLRLFRLIREQVPDMPFVFVTLKPLHPRLTELLRSERNVRAVYKNLSGGRFLPALQSAFSAAYNHNLRAW
jgi:CheY-like chemotaxis protein